MKARLTKWLESYAAVLAAIISTSIVATGVYAFEIKPRLTQMTKDQIDSCLTKHVEKDIQIKKVLDEKFAEQTKRILKIECGLYTIMSVKEKEKTNLLYEQLGGTK
jgi:siroheme synthase (precorrin-2 oxidase/ferrochelatase)